MNSPRRTRVKVLCTLAAGLVAVTLLVTLSGSKSVEIIPLNLKPYLSKTDPFLTAEEREITKRQAVILLTYMRSGSSLTGDILQQSPGTFYLYEPLHYLSRSYLTTKENLTFINGTIKKWPYSLLTEGVNIIRHWLSCDVMKLLENSLKSGFMEFGIRSKGFSQCLMEHANKKIKCALDLQTKCEQSRTLLIKTIRMPMSLIGDFLDKIPELKVIHLVRDPRATLKSQAKCGECGEKQGGHIGCINKYCTRLENDILVTETLAKRYPGRIKRVFYEQIASKPLQTARELYNFIGSLFTPQVKDYIFDITQAGKEAGCSICTTRPNSTLYINAWRKDINKDFLKTIEQRCNYVLRHFNYTLYWNYTRAELDMMYAQ